MRLNANQRVSGDAARTAGNPDIPDWLEKEYFQSIQELTQTGIAEISRKMSYLKWHLSCNCGQWRNILITSIKGGFGGQTGRAARMRHRARVVLETIVI